MGKRLLGVKGPVWDEAVESGLAPKPVGCLAGGRASARVEDEIDQHIEARIAERDQGAA
jgi:predicted DNA-binding transcriptional regulator AlpA